MKLVFKKHLYFIVLVIILGSCKNASTEQSMFTQLPSSHTGITFANNIIDSKDFNVFSFRNYYNGGGVATGDINNDGLPDVFFTANMGSNKLYLNKGNLKFEDISAKAGFIEKLQWSTGVVFVDINNDGWLDIYVSNSAHIKDGISKANQLFINNKNLTFTDKATEYGLADTGYTTQASFFDYDLDGDLDCFIINNSPIPVNTLNYANKRSLPAQNWEVKDYLKGGGDHLYRNDKGHFVEVTQQAGIYGSLISLGLGVTVGDVNNDGYLDIYVSNDFFEKDYLYVNQKNGTFKDELEQWVQHTSLSSMGADMADINNDGYPDIFTTDMMPDDDVRLKTTSSFDNIDVFNLKEQSGFYHQYQQNTLQLNNKNNQFNEIAHYSNVQASDWSWGGLIFDADNDGLQDIYVCNGIYRDVTDQDFIDFFANDVVQQMVTTGKKEDVSMVVNKMPVHPIPNKMYRNSTSLQFTDMAKQWGLAQPSHSNGASYADLDMDGDLDLIVSNVNAEAFVYENNARKNIQSHYLGITLKGDSLNTFAIGSKIQAYIGNNILSREIIPSKGFQSSIDYHQVFGLGAASAIDSLVIRWPDLTSSSYYNIKVDSNYSFKKPIKATSPFKKETSKIVSLFSEIVTSFIQHKEDDYTDFYYERNLPQLLSREGPKAAIADVNGDKLDDIYIGGAVKQAGQLYLQNAQGSFVQSKQTVFEAFADFEDVATVFFDCDKDGDADLFIGSGGNNIQVDLRNLQHRLYINDGKGNFTIDTRAFPINKMNISTVAVNDINNDGFLDLFIGSRSVLGNYALLIYQ
jgi:enediyne biosynthesis protein E4